MRFFFWRCRGSISEQEAIDAALAFLQRQHVVIAESTPIHAVFQPADQWHNSDRWLVYFDTHPGCCPPFTVVEVESPSGNVSGVPMI